MVKIKYYGDAHNFRVVVGDIVIYWQKGEVKNLEERYCKLLVENKYGGDILPYLTPNTFYFKYVDKETTTEAVKSPEKDKTTFSMDLNADGLIDNKDKSIAAKVLATKLK
jgi:hypothetical protein